VDTLVITAWNPAYSAPADLGFGELLAKVPNAMYLGLHEDETAQRCSWFIPANHVFESWGDTRAVDGTVAIIQPLISPLFNGVNEADVLAAFLGEGTKGTHALLREFWSGRAGATNFDANWESWLARGVVPQPAAETLAVALAGNAAQAIDAASGTAAPTGIELAFVPDYKVFDGRYANNPWLQELPDPLTKMTWDNAAHLSPTTAGQLKLKQGDVVKLEYRGKSVQAPVWILPGHADNSITVALGYGRLGVEEVARGVGFNAYALRHSDAPWFDGGVNVTKVAGADEHEFAITQGHWSMKAVPDDPEARERPLALEANLEEFRKKPEELTYELRKENPTLQDPVKYEGYQWAMSIDLSRCTGCNACVMACQSENNIPVVGKEQVRRGREMNWLRIDRYFRGPLENPTVVDQPVACVHCEAAPCEYVCPVNATVHSDEGLNEMIYNRCVGTRYCSNNCPYKVRRFNYLHYTANQSALRRMGNNPDVTVRARGVMEKCTYCVQRIERVRIDARVAGREILDGEIRTACQQACPTGTIQFGSLHDPKSVVSQLHKDNRRYDLLHELNTRPRTGYMVRIKNPNPELA
jgi:molybdopterin-containing oxidoreductase family iron-sulfur binding subunit